MSHFREDVRGVAILEFCIVLPIFLTMFLLGLDLLQSANTHDATRSLAASSCAAGARFLIYSDVSQKTAAETAARAAAEDAFAANKPGAFFVSSTSATLSVSFSGPAGHIVCSVTSEAPALFPVAGLFTGMGATATITD